MAAVVAEIVVCAGESGNGVEAAGSRWDEPAQDNARGERLDCSETEGLNEVGADGVRADEVVGSGAVEVGGRLWKAEEEVGVAVEPTFPILQTVGVCGEEVQPTLYVCVVLAGLGIIRKRLVINVDDELGRAEMPTEVFDGTDDATGLEGNRCPTSFVVLGNVVDEDDMADVGAQWVLVENGAKTVDAGVAVEAEMAEVVGDGVPFGKTKIECVASSFIMPRTMTLISGAKTNFTPCLSRALIEGSRVERVFKNLRYYPVPPGRKRVCLVSPGMGTILVSEAALSALGLTTEEEIVCPGSSASVSTRLACSGNSASFEVVLSKAIE